MRVRFAQFEIPRVGVLDLLDHPDKAAAFAGKVVFVGVTSLTEVHDRLQTPIAPAAQKREWKSTPTPSRPWRRGCSSPT